MFKALSIKNYRLFFMGQAISLIGTWIQRTTMGWFVYRLTNSVFLLGLISFLSMIPSVFISPFAGDLADRGNRHRIIIFTQTAALIQTSTLAIMVLTDFIHAGFLLPLILLSLLQGIIEAIDAPVRQSFILDLVGSKNIIPNAIAMNSAIFNGARLIGPSLAGLLIVLFDEGVCFSINALSYIPVIIMLLLISVQYKSPRKSDQSALRNIVDGWKYAFSNLPIRFLISNIAVFTLFGMSYGTLLPVFARDILSGDSRTLGLLMSTAGVGALTGALYLASRQSINGLGQRMIYAGATASICLILFAISDVLLLSMMLLLVIGLCLMLQMASTNTILQAVISDKMRGRVLSIYTMAYMSVTPFGSLVAGSLSSRIGVKQTLLISASICLCWTLYGIGNLRSVILNIQRMLIVNNNREIYRPAGRIFVMETQK